MIVTEALSMLVPKGVRLSNWQSLTPAFFKGEVAKTYLMSSPLERI